MRKQTVNLARGTANERQSRYDDDVVILIGDGFIEKGGTV